MTKIEFWEIVVSLGVPGLAIGVLYALFRGFNWKISRIPQRYAGPLAILFMALVAAVTVYALHLWAPEDKHRVSQRNLTGNNLVVSRGERSGSYTQDNVGGDNIYKETKGLRFIPIEIINNARNIAYMDESSKVSQTHRSGDNLTIVVSRIRNVQSKALGPIKEYRNASWSYGIPDSWQQRELDGSDTLTFLNPVDDRVRISFSSESLTPELSPGFQIKLNELDHKSAQYHPVALVSRVQQPVLQGAVDSALNELDAMEIEAELSQFMAVASWNYEAAVMKNEESQGRKVVGQIPFLVDVSVDDDYVSSERPMEFAKSFIVEWIAGGERFMGWHIFIIHKSQALNMFCEAPYESFESYAPTFQAVASTIVLHEKARKREGEKGRETDQGHEKGAVPLKGRSLKHQDMRQRFPITVD